MFQEDIFPPTASACPSLSADEWISGQNREPILVSLKVIQNIALLSDVKQKKDDSTFGLEKYCRISNFRCAENGINFILFHWIF